MKATGQRNFPTFSQPKIQNEVHVSLTELAELSSAAKTSRNGPRYLDIAAQQLRTQVPMVAG